MAALNFDWIHLMLKDASSIPRETLHSQDGLNLGNVCFCPLRRTLRMQCLSLNHLWKLITEGVFMPPQLEGPPELSRTTAILLVFQADSQYEEITDVYVGLFLCRVESHLYAPDQILDFIKDIEVNLQVVRDALKAGGDPGKRHTFCLFVSNFGDTMSIPTDLPYCLVYPTSYVRDAYAMPPCSSTMFPTILEPWNHHVLLIDSMMREPYPMEMVGDFWVADLIFKGCYRDLLLYSDADIG